MITAVERAEHVSLHRMLDHDETSTAQILGTITRQGEWWPFPQNSSDQDVLRIWQNVGDVFVAKIGCDVVGTYCIGPNQLGGGSHIANCGYASSPAHRRHGIGQILCAASLVEAEMRGDRAIQLNSVVSSNLSAISLYERNGFVVIGRVPDGFLHPKLGYVDFLIMFRTI